MKRLLVSLSALSMIAVPGLSTAQTVQGGTRAQRSQNMQATADMRSRLAAAVDRVSVAEQHHAITPVRSAALRRQLATAQADMARMARRQGFVSAAELAGYGRTVEAVDAELSTSATPHDMAGDALPSAEVTAFQKADARFHYKDARIEYDARRCAVYQGTAPDGRVRREPLRDAAGRAICQRR